MCYSCLMIFLDDLLCVSGPNSNPHLHLPEPNPYIGTCTLLLGLFLHISNILIVLLLLLNRCQYRKCCWIQHTTYIILYLRHFCQLSDESVYNRKAGIAAFWFTYLLNGMPISLIYNWCKANITRGQVKS